MVRNGGFERDEMPFMVVDVRTEVTEFVTEGINLGQEAFFHLGQRSNVAGVELGHRIGIAVHHFGHRNSMAFLHFAEAVVQLGKQRSNMVK